MNIKKTLGFTLLETLTASTIASIIITSALSIVGSIYFNQRRIQLSHDFYSESRYMMERIAQISRNNTIDYDRYFEIIGPPVARCGSFSGDQVPSVAAVTNNDTDRKTLEYSDIFYWDTNGDGTQDRNLGGLRPVSGQADEVDPCVLAWESSTQSTLYFINANRTLRTAIKFNATDNTIEVQRQLGADTDNDGIIDIWAPHDENENNILEAPDTEIVWESNDCKIKYDVDKIVPRDVVSVSIFGNSSDRDYCEQAHKLTKISPVALKINSLEFSPTPNQDPFLSFRVDSSQVHPSVFIKLDIEMRNPESYGFSATDVPDINFQTTVSSRVFGNIRK